MEMDVSQNSVFTGVQGDGQLISQKGLNYGNPIPING